jgi:hypothetical protein
VATASAFLFLRAVLSVCLFSSLTIETVRVTAEGQRGKEQRTEHRCCRRDKEGKSHSRWMDKVNRPSLVESNGHALKREMPKGPHSGRSSLLACFYVFCCRSAAPLRRLLPSLSVFRLPSSRFPRFTVCPVLFSLSILPPFSYPHSLCPCLRGVLASLSPLAAAAVPPICKTNEDQGENGKI